MTMKIRFIALASILTVGAVLLATSPAQSAPVAPSWLLAKPDVHAIAQAQYRRRCSDDREANTAYPSWMCP
jgi:hypothetical protein